MRSNIPKLMLFFALSLLTRNTLAESKSVLVLVNEDLETSEMKHSFDTYVQDLEFEGYHVVFNYFKNESSSVLRDFILDTRHRELAVDGRAFSGVVLIGEFPHKPYLLKDRTREAPSELYFTIADLEALNRCFETRSCRPDFWISRISARNLENMSSQKEHELIKRYLHWNHQIRTCEASVNSGAFVYNGNVAQGKVLRSLSQSFNYGELVPVAHKSFERGFVMDLLTDASQEVIDFCAHSSPTAHQFHDLTTLQSRDVFSLKIRSLFLALTACSAADFSKSDYISGAYLFGNQIGAIIGFTFPANQYIYPNIYERLAKGKSIGDAFVEEIRNFRHGWEYILAYALLGDGTLTAQEHRFCQTPLQDPPKTISLSFLQEKAQREKSWFLHFRDLIDSWFLMQGFA